MRDSYKRLAEIYDCVYSFKDYKKESDIVHRVIQKYSRSGGRELLDLCCGTGAHIQHLRKRYIVTGLDKSPQMLKIARTRNKSVRFVRADMNSFHLKKKFDAIVCLFSSVAYLRTKKNFATFASRCLKHLKPGGVLIIEPFVSEKLYKKSTIPFALVSEQPKLRVLRMNAHGPVRNHQTRLVMHYLVGTKGKVEHRTDIHSVGFIEPEDMVKILKARGFKAWKSKENLTHFRAGHRGQVIGLA